MTSQCYTLCIWLLPNDLHFLGATTFESSRSSEYVPWKGVFLMIG